MQKTFTKSLKLEKLDGGWDQKVWLHFMIFITPSKMIIFFETKNQAIPTVVKFKLN